MYTADYTSEQIATELATMLQCLGLLDWDNVGEVQSLIASRLDDCEEYN
jgi:hypothetical protein